MQKVTRRDFLRTTGAAGVAAGLGTSCQTIAKKGTAQGAERPKITASAPPGKATANEKIALGFVGVGGRGTSLLEEFMRFDDVVIPAIADVYAPHAEKAAERVQNKYGKRPNTYKDFRELLERKDIDAIVCATPPHWHPLVTIFACQAGKDVYCEKPMCYSPVEAEAMVKAARANHRVTQIGTQIHATENYHHVVEIVRSGLLGKISRVHCVLSLNEAPEGIGKTPNTTPPPDLDWDMWCGPRPLLPYNPVIFTEGRHRYLREIVGSWIHEMGPHIVDLPVWALDLHHPRSVVAQGGKFATDDISTIPDTMEVIWDYGDFIMTWTNQCANSHGLEWHRGGDRMTRRLCISFFGVNGTLIADYNSLEVFSEGERLRKEDLPPIPKRTWPEHSREFLDCVRSRALPSCDVSYHERVHIALNLGQFALDLDRKLHWDGEKRQFVNDAQANEYMQPKYRAPWVLPA
jgi:predicted dehydrogenase